jgi:hypothetical protein
VKELPAHTAVAVSRLKRIIGRYQAQFQKLGIGQNFMNEALKRMVKRPWLRPGGQLDTMVAVAPVGGGDDRLWSEVMRSLCL